MKIIKPYHEIITPLNGKAVLQRIEECGRVCYKSEGKITEDSCYSFVRGIVRRGHEAVLEQGTRAFASWRGACETAERSYFTLLDWGCTPQEARAVLPNSLKTEVIMTANIREWRHFFKLRSAKAAHPQMRELVIPLLLELKANIPIVFDDIPVA